MRCVQAFLLVVASCLVASPATAHRVTQDEVTNFHTHTILAQRGVELLKDKLQTDVDAAAEFTGGEITTMVGFLDLLLADSSLLLASGQSDADYSGGVLDVFNLDNYEVPRNAFAHFYNPQTERGLRGLNSNYHRFWAAAGFTSFEFTQIMGPNTPATDMANWYYARAIHAMQEGNFTQAANDISYVVHYMHDLTVPQHACDGGAEIPQNRHTEYEAWVNDNLASITPIGASFSEIFGNASLTPSELGKIAAEASNPFCAEARSTDEAVLMEITKPLVKLAVDLTAVVLLKLFSEFQVGTVPVVVLRITSAKNNGFNDGFLNTVDMRAYAGFNGGELAAHGFLADCAEFKPQDLLDSNGWTFIHRLTPAEQAIHSVDVQIQIHDVYSDFFAGPRLGKTEEVIPITSDGNTTLEFAFNITDEIVTGASDGQVLITYEIGRAYMLESNFKNVDFSRTFGFFSAAGAALAITFLILCFCCCGCCGYGGWLRCKKDKDKQAAHSDQYDDQLQLVK